VAVAHGKMGEDALSDVMQDMANGDIQVLVCTTIIETGLDIPNVNTLIIENADRFGLSQLHQLRGRVGRSTRHAYAYFTYRPDKNLTEVAEKRLTAIRDFAEFGSYTACKEKGVTRLEGKDYIVQDGDIVHFRFAV
jgi:transcription-repair coupling factor (superfamily II helicase)